MIQNATLYISSASASKAAERFLSGVRAGVVQISKCIRRNPDSREVERGYVAYVKTEAQSFYL